ncbi:hypothetical protein KAR50_03125 [Periweissella fabaria]|uniref:DUF2798 domain-containing protein n=1 Tax=Periweissella fabaria TaxID=546157 RepID=A0ABM8Z5I6_9LACO|nr:hypothetical protein [Periweissella fabaria]MCM0596840.1 hypothetical protein [Periweissella fabaria]CAH0416577.1 hypothetical protein WFA24289_00881 [Periweissella fabaria]
MKHVVKIIIGIINTGILSLVFYYVAHPVFLPIEWGVWLRAWLIAFSCILPLSYLTPWLVHKLLVRTGLLKEL